ncbi:MAG: TIGR04086 family membrane protein [Clostridia bacterium]|nr:TIGR04086 family membrane protein [Clostridia bacterium]
MDIAKNRSRIGGFPLWLCSLIGGGIGLGVTVACALLIPLLIKSTADPNSLVKIMAAACVFLGGAVGGFIASMQSRSFASGMLSAAVCAVCMLVVSLFSEQPPEWSSALASLLALIASSALGSYLATATQKNKKRSMKRAMKRRKS